MLISKADILKVPCERCGAKIGEECTDLRVKWAKLKSFNPHPVRARAAKKAWRGK